MRADLPAMSLQTSAWSLRALAFVLRLLGNLGYYCSRIVINIYDLVIFPALWLEGVIIRALSKGRDQKLETVGETDAIEKHKQDNFTLMEGTARCNEVID